MTPIAHLVDGNSFQTINWLKNNLVVGCGGGTSLRAMAFRQGRPGSNPVMDFVNLFLTG